MTGGQENKLYWMAMAVLLIGFAVWLGINMHVLGYRFWTQPDIELDYAVGVFWWAVIAVGILACGGESRSMVFYAWAGKFFVVLVAMLFYEYSYGLDAGGYHLAAKTGIHDYYPGIDFREDMWPTWKPLRTPTGELMGAIGSENVIRYLMLIARITGPYYHAMKVMCAFMGLLGAWWFYQAVVVALGKPYTPAFYLLAFFPSIIFWSSILGKDPIQFFFLGLYAYGAALWLVEGGGVALCILGMGLLGTISIRPWLGLLQAGSMVIALLFGNCRAWQRWLAFAVFLPVLYWGGMNFLDQRSVTNADMLLDFLQEVPAGVARTGAGGSSAGGLEIAGAGDFGANLPMAMFAGLFRPLPFDITNPFTAMAALENTAVLLLALLAFLKFRPADLRDSLVLWTVSYSLIWAVMYGFIVMANFGAGARYKLQAWPFLLMAILIFVHREGRSLLISRRAL